MRTLGELVDRLCTVNMKLFHLQDKVHAAAAAGTGLDADTVRGLANLNRERSALMNQIDECFASGLASGGTPVEHRHKV